MKKKTKILGTGAVLFGAATAILFVFRPRHEKIIASRPEDLISGRLYEVTTQVEPGNDVVKIKIVDRENGELWAFDSNKQTLGKSQMKPFKKEYTLVGRFIYDPEEVKEEGVIRVECRSQEVFSIMERIPKITLIL